MSKVYVVTSFAGGRLLKVEGVFRTPEALKRAIIEKESSPRHVQETKSQMRRRISDLESKCIPSPLPTSWFVEGKVDYQVKLYDVIDE